MKTIILKNTTLDPMEILGRIVPNGGQEDFSTEPVGLLRTASTLETDISSGDVVVNDGTNDLSVSTGLAYISDTVIFQEEDTDVIEILTVLNFEGAVTIVDEGDLKVTVTSVTQIQNLWETIVTDSGSVTVNIAADTLNVLGTPDETVTSAASDNLFIGIADNPILPGLESVTIPIGTTAQRPVTPTVGMLRFNSTLNCTEEYDGTDWTCLRTVNSLVGGLYQMIFSVNGIIKNAWMDQGADNVSSDSTFAITLARSKVVAFTYTNSRTDVDVDLEIYSTPEGIAPTIQQDLEFTWSLTDVRSARKSNFASDIIFEAGDKVGVFSNDPGGTTPSSAIFIVFLQYLEDNNEEVIDNNVGDMN